MAHITSEQIRAAYAVATRVFDEELTPENGARELRDKFGLNVNSARDFIRQYRAMLRDKAFKRSMSAPAMKYFLSQIARDRGQIAVETALSAAWKHVGYYEAIQNARLNKLRSVLESFQTKLTEPVSQGLHESRFAAAVTHSMRDTAAARKKRLQQASKIPTVSVAITRVYTRNPDVVAEVLARARGHCELCSKPAPFRRNTDRTPYLEVHHKVQFADGGEDSVDNAIALCPNCHRQQHYG